MLQYMLLLLAVGALGARLADRVKMPGGSFLGAMLATAAVSLALPDARPLPEGLRTASLLLLGICIGSTVQRRTLLRIRTALPTASLLIVALIVAGLIMGWSLYQVSDREISLVTILLGIMPGGASGLAAAAYDMGGDPSIVASLHAVRQIIVFGLLPLFLRRMAKPSDRKAH